MLSQLSPLSVPSRSRVHGFGILSLGVLAAALSFELAAQEQAGTLEEITVTARRVAENLQDTPIAVTVVSGDALEERQVFETTELDQLVPNLQFSDNAPLAGNNSSSQVFIRGIGQTDPTSTVDPGVGLYMDDVYIGSAVGATMGLRDIASIQTLRGPQGTLFGRNTIGGAILVTTVEPGEEGGGTLRGSFGSDSLIDAFAAFDAPFSDDFKSRFSIGMRQQDGYVTRTDGTDLGDTDVQVATAKFTWTPGDNVTARFAFDYTTADENGSPLVFAVINEAATFPRVASYDAGCPGMTDVLPPPGLPDQNVPMTQNNACANDLQARGPYANNGTYPLTSELENTGFSANIAVDLSDTWELKSISSVRNLDWAGNRDADNTPLPILHTLYDVDASQWSQELQLTMQSDALTGVSASITFSRIPRTSSPSSSIRHRPGSSKTATTTSSITTAGPCSRSGRTRSQSGSTSRSVAGTRRKRSARTRINTRSIIPPRSRCPSSGTRTRSAISRRRRRWPTAGPTKGWAT